MARVALAVDVVQVGAVAGVEVQQHAQVQLSPAAADSYEQSPWEEDKPARDLVRSAPVPRAAPEGRAESIVKSEEHGKLMSRILAGTEASAAADLWRRLGHVERTLMLSAGGPGTGGTWSAPHRHALDLMQNSHWQAATLLRLRLWTPERGTTCQLRRQQDGRYRKSAEGKQQCGKLLAAECLHPFRCEHGAAKIRPHDAVEMALANVLARAGADVDVERNIPELADTVWDAKTKQRNVDGTKP